MPTLTINTGDVTYQILNEVGEEIGVIRFNPADVDIVKRFEQMQENIKALTFPKKFTVESLYEFSDKIKEQFDFLLNRKVSGEIFKVCNPLTIMADGGYFYAGVMDSITEIISTEMKKRREQSAKKIDDAVAQLTQDE